jgi:transcriptional antiterminator RfaH
MIVSQWFVVNTLPHQEARAEANLRRQGYRAWLPSIKRSRRHARRIDTILAPLFPGYVFVELDLSHESWSPINGTFGVRRLLCHRDRPAPVPDNFMQALRETLNEEGVVAVPEPLKPGQKVRLIAGPFVDCIGTLLYLAAKGRVALLLSVLGQEVSTMVSRRMLAPAG